MSEPLQLDLFQPESEPLMLDDAPSAAAAVSQALERGLTVKLRKGRLGFELLVPQGAPRGETCGFSKRAVELLVRGVERGGQTFWARPAGGSWAGWAEWGTFTGQ